MCWILDSIIFCPSFRINPKVRTNYYFNSRPSPLLHSPFLCPWVGPTVTSRQYTEDIELCLLGREGEMLRTLVPFGFLFFRFGFYSYNYCVNHASHFPCAGLFKSFTQLGKRRWSVELKSRQTPWWYSKSQTERDIPLAAAPQNVHQLVHNFGELADATAPALTWQDHTEQMPHGDVFCVRI